MSPPLHRPHPPSGRGARRTRGSAFEGPDGWRELLLERDRLRAAPRRARASGAELRLPSSSRPSTRRRGSVPTDAGRHPCGRVGALPDRAGPPVRRRPVELADAARSTAPTRSVVFDRPAGLRARPGGAGRGDGRHAGAAPPQGRRARRRRRSGCCATTASTGTTSRRCGRGSTSMAACGEHGDRDVLSQLLEFAVHDLGAGASGRSWCTDPTTDPIPTYELRLPVPPPLQIGRPADLAPLHPRAQPDRRRRGLRRRRAPCASSACDWCRAREAEAEVDGFRRHAPHRRPPLQLRRLRARR